MATNFKKGDQVEQILPAPITGSVAGFGLCQETGDVSMRVVYTDADGVEHERFFKAEEIKVIPPEPAAEEPAAAGEDEPTKEQTPA